MAEPEETDRHKHPPRDTQERAAGRHDTMQAADRSPELADVGELHEPIMREKREPRDGYEPVPLWLVGLFFVLIFWGGWYLAWYSGGFRADVLDERPNFGALGTADSGKPVDPMVLGEKLFSGRCVSCHQQNGKGVTGQYPPLAGSNWVLENPQRLKRVLLHGLEGPVTVQGASYNGNMPAFGKVFNDEKLAAVLTYIRGSWGNDALPISAESVAATREATADRTSPWTADELTLITEDDPVPTEETSGDDVPKADAAETPSPPE